MVNSTLENTFNKKKTQRWKKKVTSESNWKKYYGSSDELKKK